MLIERKEDGSYTSGIVYTTLNGRKVAVCQDAYEGKTYADVIKNAYGNALYLHQRQALCDQMRVSR